MGTKRPNWSEPWKPRVGGFPARIPINSDVEIEIQEGRPRFPESIHASVLDHFPVSQGHSGSAVFSGAVFSPGRLSEDAGGWSKPGAIRGSARKADSTHRRI